MSFMPILKFQIYYMRRNDKEAAVNHIFIYGMYITLFSLSTLKAATIVVISLSNYTMKVPLRGLLS